MKTDRFPSIWFNAWLGMGLVALQLVAALLAVHNRADGAPGLLVVWCAGLVVAGFVIQVVRPAAYLVASISMLLGMLLIRLAVAGLSLNATVATALLIAFAAVALGESLALISRRVRRWGASKRAS